MSLQEAGALNWVNCCPRLSIASRTMMLGVIAVDDGLALIGEAPSVLLSEMNWDGKGAFGVLAWNASGGAKPNGSRSIPNVSITPASPLYVVRVLPGDANTAECKALAAQNWVHLSISAHTATLDLVDLPAHAAVLISTAACDELAN